MTFHVVTFFGGCSNERMQDSAWQQMRSYIWSSYFSRDVCVQLPRFHRSM